MPMQPGHPHERKHPGRKSGHEPPDTHPVHHGAVSAPKLVKHKIGSHHVERTAKATAQPPADGVRSRSQITTGMAALRPQHIPGMAGMVDGAPQGPMTKHQPRAMPKHGKVPYRQVGSAPHRDHH